jgi:D-alanine-D-alanine ligase-like ATP-grasp enzyme
MISGSGSTGKSKYFSLTHTQIVTRLKLNEKILNFQTDDVMYTMVHLDFTVGKLRLLDVIYTGAAIVLHNRKTPFSSMMIERFGITHLHGTVFYYESILKNLQPEDSKRFHTLRSIWIGMSNVGERLRHKLTHAINPNVLIMYGSNECSPIAALTVNSSSDPLSVGTVVSGVVVEIVDEFGKLVLDGSIGDVRMKSDAMITQYHDDTEATAKAFRDGWFYPGDLGKWDTNGELLHCGRSDDMLIMNGINIYPLEIEVCMNQYPGIEQTAVIAMKHTLHQEFPVCAIVVSEGHTINLDDFLRFGQERLGGRCAREAFVIDEIPYTSMGKPNREELRQLAQRALSEKQTKNRSNLSKPFKFLSFEQEHPSSEMLQNLQSWFARLEIAFPVNDQPIVEFMMCTVRLAQLIAIQGGITLFDEPSIVRIQHHATHDNRYRITLKLASIDPIDNQTYGFIINQANKLIATMQTCDDVERDYELLTQRIYQIIHRLRKDSRVGQSTLALLNHASTHSIPFIHLGEGVYQFGWGKNARKIDRSTSDLDSKIGSKLSHNKATSAQLLQMAGLPTATHICVTREADLAVTATKLGWPLVVKPADLDRGEGVEIDISNVDDLKRAFHHAYRSSKIKQVLLEQHIPGVCHRIFIAGGKMLYALKRLPIGVFGDGVSSIDELIDEHNHTQLRTLPWQRSPLYLKDTQTITHLSHNDLSLKSIPKIGEWITLRPIESTQWGGRDEDVGTTIHPDNIALSIRAAELFSLDIAGVDIISEDISVPWYVNNAIINEINYSPLLGGGAISLRSIGYFFETMLDGDGRIPIELFIGSQGSMDHALKAQEHFIGRGIKAYVTSENETISPDHQTIHLTQSGINNRVKALLLDPNVEAIIVAISTDEVLKEGFIATDGARMQIVSPYVISSNGVKISTKLFVQQRK